MLIPIENLHLSAPIRMIGVRSNSQLFSGQVRWMNDLANQSVSSVSATSVYVSLSSPTLCMFACACSSCRDNASELSYGQYVCLHGLWCERAAVDRDNNNTVQNWTGKKERRRDHFCVRTLLHPIRLPCPGWPPRLTWLISLSASVVHR